MSKVIINDIVEIPYISGFQQNVSKNEEIQGMIVNLTIRVAESDDPDLNIPIDDLLLDLLPYFEDDSIQIIKFYSNDNIEIYRSTLYDKIKDVNVQSIIDGHEFRVEKQIYFEKIMPIEEE